MKYTVQHFAITENGEVVGELNPVDEIHEYGVPASIRQLFSTGLIHTVDLRMVGHQVLVRWKCEPEET